MIRTRQPLHNVLKSQKLAIYGLHARARARTCPAKNRLVQIYITIPDLKVVTAIRIGTYPSFVVNRRSLATEIR